MSEDDNFFAMPPMDAPPMEGEGDFTMIGNAPPPEDDPPMVGDVDEADMFGDMGFAASAPSDDMGFAGGAPAPEEDMYSPLEEDAFAAPPAAAEDAPIILGGPPPAEPETVEDEEPMMAPVSMEPSAMQKWNEEWQLTLAARKEEENTKKADMVEAARVTLEQFQAEKEAKRESKMAKNREDEQAKLEAIEADLENDNSWQKVCKLVELSHDGAHEGEDVKRMRDVLILLKNEPARAAAVGA